MRGDDEKGLGERLLWEFYLRSGCNWEVCLEHSLVSAPDPPTQSHSFLLCTFHMDAQTRQAIRLYHQRAEGTEQGSATTEIHREGVGGKGGPIETLGPSSSFLSSKKCGRERQGETDTEEYTRHCPVHSLRRVAWLLEAGRERVTPHEHVCLCDPSPQHNAETFLKRQAWDSFLCPVACSRSVSVSWCRYRF